MIRIDRMTLQLPADCGDPRALGRDAAERIARALVGATGTLDRISVDVGPAEDVGTATARVLDAELRRRG